MQVELRLHDPRTAAQPAHDIPAYAGAVVVQRFVAVEQRLGIELVGQGRAQHGFFVALRLLWHGRGRHAAGRCTRWRVERLDIADFRTEQVRVGIGLTFGLLGNGTLALAAFGFALECGAQ